MLCENQIGPRDQRPRRRDALLLAAGQLGGPVLEPVGDAERADQFRQPRGVGLLAAQGERQEHILPCGQRGYEVERLEDEADPLPAQQRHRLVRQVTELDTAE